MAAVVDSHWQLFALAVSVSGAGSGWLASVIDVGGKRYHSSNSLVDSILLADVYLLTVFLFAVLFSVPAINLCLNLGYVSGNGPVQTYRRMAPIASGTTTPIALIHLCSRLLFLLRCWLGVGFSGRRKALLQTTSSRSEPTIHFLRHSAASRLGTQLRFL